MEDEISTAEEIFKIFFNINKGYIDYDKAGLEIIKKSMIDFAKLHVEAALKAASESKSNGTEGYKIYKDSVLSAYPLTNIK